MTNIEIKAHRLVIYPDPPSEKVLQANRLGAGKPKPVTADHVYMALDALLHCLPFEDIPPKVTVASTDDESFFCDLD